MEQKLKTAYEQHLPMFHRLSAKYHEFSKIPKEEFISAFNMCFWICYQNYREGSASFSTYLHTKLTQKAIDITRKKHNRYYLKAVPIDTGTDDSERNLPQHEPSHEVDFLAKKKRADQRQLIDYILQAAKPDDVTINIVTNFGKYESITALAKALGLHPEFVKRKLKRLSKYYDANKFGDYKDYLAV